MATLEIIQILILTIIYCSLVPSLGANYNPTLDVWSFGAVPDGKSDCTEAFTSAWGSACASVGPTTIYVPPGKYLLQNTYFSGTSCENTDITIRIDGTLVAPSDYEALEKNGSWLQFERVAGVSILGGTLDGQGTRLWECKNSGENCPKGVTSLAFYNSNNIKINGLTSLDSQMFHIIIDGCENVDLTNVRVWAPENSPNTDGIHVQQSTRVTIMNSLVGTGDDCVSIGPGSSDLWIENLWCGPGHGISIGSLGWEAQEAGVQNVTVKSVKFSGTQNGVRIKTWARPSNGFVRNVLFQHLVMNDVQNPIIIDQNYCPGHENCPTQTSGVKISDVTYQDIHGTSTTKVAVKFECSKTRPCSEITLDEVNLTYGDKSAVSSCANAGGTTGGINFVTADELPITATNCMRQWKWMVTVTTLGISNSNNVAITGLTSINSQLFHIVINGCRDVRLRNVTISAPGDSPNTDGIHVQRSSDVAITDSKIGTGDDCVSVGPGTADLWIENDYDELGVHNVTVQSVSFDNTRNGVRIKTWARPSKGFVSGVVFRHAVMCNVENPIVIDQNYCPHEKDCPGQVSGVEISDVTYQDIQGTSATQVAVKFDCSNECPCKGIKMEKVRLSYQNQQSRAQCVNAAGSVYGSVEPSSCLN
ncbi:pectin lyase-like superfamily protein [Striga asiatica]|uniref:Pectin lyase-like superfamily protein n=1 Tax=Striga asiatica TaxID=4170 RepID=A0A5A7Q0L5_STRAF|nr:pectin lyase-like superfamily protein [Striga asiatica]